MSRVKLLMPSMGEGIHDATLTKIVKKAGDKVNEDETIVEVATDKVDNEIPSPASGVVEQYFFKEGDTVAVGATIAIIRTGDGSEMGEEIAPQPEDKTKKEAQAPATETPADKTQTDAPAGQMTSRTQSGKFLSPLVRSIAQSENISATELDAIKGTGLDGRLTKEDMLLYLQQRNKQEVAEKAVTKTEAVAQPAKAQTTPPAAKIDYGQNFDIIEMDRMRKLIAKNMLASKQTSPHVSSFVEVDVTPIVNWREKMKDVFQKRYNEKLTFTPIFIEAVAKALKDFPMVNVSVDGDKIIVKKDINIGMAAALPDGNLIVPVIKNADRMNLAGVAYAVNDLARRARASQLKPDEIRGGTFTITNVGTFGNITGTPIINQPEVAILAIGAIRKKPAVIETAQGDFIAIRQLMIMSLSYDHRVVDGSLGGSFLKRIADYLEGFDDKRDI